MLNLPDDSILCIAQFLDFESFRHFRDCSGRVRRGLEGLRRRCINLANTPPRNALRLLQKIASSEGDEYESLLSLNIHGLPADINLLVVCISNKCKRLQVLNLQHCPKVDSKTVLHIAAHLKEHLREISLWETGVQGSGISKAALLTLVTECTRLEVVDFRGQANVDDEVIAALASNRRLQRISVAGTAMTSAGLNALTTDCSDCIVRLGCIGLVPPFSGVTEKCIVHGRELRELQVGFSYAPIWIDFERCPNLEFLGVSRGGGSTELSNLGDWSKLKMTSVRQITLDNCSYFAEEVLAALYEVADRLENISLTFVDRDIKKILARCVNLRQIAVYNPDDELINILSLLPRLTHIRFMSMLPSTLSVVSNDSATSFAFPSLTHLSLDIREDIDDPVDDAVAAIKNMTHLEGLYLGGSSWGEHIRDVLQGLPRMLKQLSLEEVEGGVVDLIGSFQGLERLYLPASQKTPDLIKVVASLPNLQVFGERCGRGNMGTIFSRWTLIKDSDGGGRYLRCHEPHGYFESSVIKGFDEFLTLLNEDIDPFFPIAYV